MQPTVHFTNRDFNESLQMQAFQAQVERLSWSAQGGPEAAQVTVSGPELGLWQLGQMLRYGVEIRNQLGEPIWWGYVRGVEISVGGIAFGLSLDRMSNSIAVAYTTADGDTSTTAFLADAESVLAYGTKQLLITADGLTTAAAGQVQASALSQRKLPVSTPPYRRGRKNNGVTVTLDCRGWYGTLDWRYYRRDEGRLVNLGSSEYAQPIGLGSTGTGFGFLSGVRHVVSLGARLGNLRKGDTFRISGSVSNDGVYTVEQGTEREAIAYTVSTISFDAATREIRDSANGLGTFDAHDVILVSGSASNDGAYRVESSSADGSKFVTVGTLGDEAAGASITLNRGHGVVVAEALTEELPGASITWRALGTQAAQSFRVDSAEVWAGAAAAVKVQRVGSPSDNLVIAIHGDAAGAPGTLLDSATIAGGDLPVASGWATVDLSNTQSLVPGATYWLVVSRDGANTYGDYYQVMVDIDLGYAPEILRLYDGVGWVSRPVDANLLFRLTGLEDTNVQMEKLLETAAEFVVRSEVAASGTKTNQWRAGDNTALVEMENLLNLGTSNYRRMLATVTRERTVLVQEEAAKPETIVFFQNGDGDLVDRYGAVITGYPPVGQWVDLKDVLPDAVQLPELLRPAPYLLERAEYRVETQEWELEGRGATSVWNFTAMREG